MTTTLGNSKALVDAFRELVDFVSACGATSPLAAPNFSYLLTKKQLDAIRRICASQKWAPPKNRGIEIGTPFISHVLRARSIKDKVDAAFVALVLSRTFCAEGVIKFNQGDRHSNQAILLNATTSLPLNGSIFYGMAIFDVESKGGVVVMSPITAYHANSSKVRKIDAS